MNTKETYRYSGKVIFIRINERAAYVRFKDDTGNDEKRYDFFVERQRFPVAWQVLMQIREKDQISVRVRMKGSGLVTDLEIEGQADEAYTRIF